MFYKILIYSWILASFVCRLELLPSAEQLWHLVLRSRGVTWGSGWGWWGWAGTSTSPQERALGAPISKGIWKTSEAHSENALHSSAAGWLEVSRQLSGSRSPSIQHNPPWSSGSETVVLLSCMENQIGQQCLSSTMFPIKTGATGVDMVL